MTDKQKIEMPTIIMQPGQEYHIDCDGLQKATGNLQVCGTETVSCSTGALPKVEQPKNKAETTFSCK